MRNEQEKRSVSVPEEFAEVSETQLGRSRQVFLTNLEGYLENLEQVALGCQQAEEETDQEVANNIVLDLAEDQRAKLSELAEKQKKSEAEVAESIISQNLDRYKPTMGWNRKS